MKTKDNKINNAKLYAKAIERWGKESQVEMLIEECSELILALQKLKREPQKKDNVYEEIADVKIMIEQAHLLFPKKKIDEIYHDKIERLERRVNSEICVRCNIPMERIARNIYVCEKCGASMEYFDI